MNWKKLADAETPPPLFHPGDSPFWSDPYLSSHILYAHLDSSGDDGSRPLDQIEREAAWMMSLCSDGPRRLLDLGCGPGLYTRHFARAGWWTAGIDLSPTSIAYAKEHAREEELTIKYQKGDFLTEVWPGHLDLVTMIYGTWGVLDWRKLPDLLDKVHHALKPGGLFVFDAFTQNYWEKERQKDPEEPWYVAEEGGFWSPKPHLALIRRFDYLEEHTFTRQYTVVTAQQVKTFRLWYRWYTEQEIARLLAEAGFEALFFGDLEGNPPEAAGDWLGVAARKKGEVIGPGEV